MLTNYLKTSLRQIARHKVFSAINIFGLALGMSVCLLIIMLIKDAFGYDLFHPDGDRIYRINTIAIRKTGSTETYATSPFPTGKAVADESAQIEQWTPLLRSFGGRMISGEKSLAFRGMFTDHSFFDVFGFPLQKGQAETALSAPYSVVLTDLLANALFGDEDPVGQTLEIPGYAAPFAVTGVLAPFPGKTHLEFAALSSLETAFAEERQTQTTGASEDWTDYYQCYNYIRLRKGAQKDAVAMVLTQLAETQYADVELESRDKGYRFELQALHKITPGPVISNSMGEGLPWILLIFLSTLGLIIILSACFNYTNLTIARSLVRAREIGVRKVLGASRRQVVMQILSEAMCVAVLALVVAYFLLKFIKPQFERLSITEVFDINIREDILLYILFFGFALLIGVIAGALPAISLSRTTPAVVLQKFGNIRLIQRFGLRKVLLTIQFAVTLIFLITMTVAWRQANHAIVSTFGYDQPGTLLVECREVEYLDAATALSQVSGVERISGISVPMGTWRDAAEDVRTEASAERRGVRQYFIDASYLDHFKIKLDAGENFPDNPSQQREQFVIVNETFARDFGLGSATEAVGKPIIVGDSTQLVVRGVTEDFPFKPAVYAMEPLMLRYDVNHLRIANVQLNSKNIPATMVALENAWKKLDTDQPFDATFYHDEVRATYSEAYDLIRVVGFFGIMGIVVVCMGLLGLSTYTAESKAKEISIRKVMGATLVDIVVYLSRGYLILFGIAACIALPVGYLLGYQILQSFADRISLSVLLFLPAVAILLLSAGVTVGSQALRAARGNPVQTLRAE